ncbi:unnamed protein product [Moneuplotes crassus]|uniref:4a-hydroxytetrahydrobiopterin dehydratase n=2 Tax=Euplotes crassus TaxID=5936 RepID=A0AAD1XZW5_EUPCR|nr:unnamed protein product [Moneuplotes crassus]
MLASHLKKIRADRVLSTAAKSAAVENLAGEWNLDEENTLTKEFLFPTYEGANNFLLRFNDYCSKINRKPQWRNVYNTVTVSLQDNEFDDVTTKELEVARYLDEVYDVTLNFDELVENPEFHASEVLIDKPKRVLLLDY